MSRKGENIRRRKDGRWEARCLVTEVSTGKKKYIYLYAKSYAEVREKKYRRLAEWQSENYPGQADCENRNYRMEYLIDKWNERTKSRVKLSTYTSYLRIAENYILPEFGGYYTSELTNLCIADFLQKEKQNGYAFGTIHLIAVVLRSILHFGAEKKALFAEELHVDFPKGEEQKNQIMNKKDYQKLKTCLSAPKNSAEAGLLLCMFSGIRLGELSGLKWADIDLNQGMMQIKRTISRIKNTEYTSVNGQSKTILYSRVPKTNSSIRKVPIPDFISNILIQYQKTEDCYLMTEKPKCMDPRTIQRKFRKILESLNIPPVKIHSLRHHFATNWIEHSFDSKNLSEILGHSSVRTTLDIYVHGDFDKKKECMNHLADLNEWSE